MSRKHQAGNVRYQFLLTNSSNVASASRLCNSNKFHTPQELNAVVEFEEDGCGVVEGVGVFDDDGVEGVGR